MTTSGVSCSGGPPGGKNLPTPLINVQPKLPNLCGQMRCHWKDLGPNVNSFYDDQWRSMLRGAPRGENIPTALVNVQTKLPIRSGQVRYCWKDLGYVTPLTPYIGKNLLVAEGHAPPVGGGNLFVCPCVCLSVTLRTA